MAKKNAASLAGMQGAIAADEQVSEQMLMASEIASKGAFQRKEEGGSIIYKLLDTNIKGSYDLILIDDVASRTGTGNERVRVLQGVDTIYQKDQKDIDKDYIKSNKRRLIFQKGKAIVPKWDKTVIDFLEICNSNIDNPNPTQPRNTKFFKWNPKKQAEELMRKEQVELDAIFAARDAKEEDMRKHASYLGISFVDELGEPIEDIRPYYIRRAKQDAKTFLDSMKSKEVEISYLIKKAIRDAKIDTGREHNAIHWANGGMICKLPMSRTALEYLVELASTNSEDGRNFLKELQDRV